MSKEMFYVMETRTLVGNCVLWWCADAKGYTCDLDKAGQYTKEQVEGMRATDVAVPILMADRAAVTHVRRDHLGQAGLKFLRPTPEEHEARGFGKAIAMLRAKAEAVRLHSDEEARPHTGFEDAEWLDRLVDAIEEGGPE